MGICILHLYVPKDFGIGKPAQMSVEEALAGGKGEGCGLYRKTEVERFSGVIDVDR